MPALNTSRFIYHNRTFIADISDLYVEGIRNAPADLILINPATGFRVCYEMCATVRDEDDVLGWRYRPVFDTEPSPEIAATSVFIRND